MGSDWIDDWSDSLDEREFPDDETFPDDSADLIPCPECGAEIYDDSEQCPRCGSYLIHQNNTWSGRPAWWVILGLLGIVAVIAVLSLS